MWRFTVYLTAVVITMHMLFFILNLICAL